MSVVGSGAGAVPAPDTGAPWLAECTSWAGKDLVTMLGEVLATDPASVGTAAAGWTYLADSLGATQTTLVLRRIDLAKVWSSEGGEAFLRKIDELAETLGAASQFARARASALSNMKSSLEWAQRRMREIRAQFEAYPTRQQPIEQEPYAEQAREVMTALAQDYVYYTSDVTWREPLPVYKGPVNLNLDAVRGAVPSALLAPPAEVALAGTPDIGAPPPGVLHQAALAGTQAHPAAGGPVIPIPPPTAGLAMPAAPVGRPLAATSRAWRAPRAPAAPAAPGRRAGSGTPSVAVPPRMLGSTPPPSLRGVKPVAAAPALPAGSLPPFLPVRNGTGRLSAQRPVAPREPLSAPTNPLSMSPNLAGPRGAPSRQVPPPAAVPPAVPPPAAVPPAVAPPAATPPAGPVGRQTTVSRPPAPRKPGRPEHAPARPVDPGTAEAGTPPGAVLGHRPPRTRAQSPTAPDPRVAQRTPFTGAALPGSPGPAAPGAVRPVLSGRMQGRVGRFTAAWLREQRYAAAGWPRRPVPAEEAGLPTVDHPWVVTPAAPEVVGSAQIPVRRDSPGPAVRGPGADATGP
jgi:hypothetical protein